LQWRDVPFVIFSASQPIGQDIALRYVHPDRFGVALPDLHGIASGNMCSLDAMILGSNVSSAVIALERARYGLWIVTWLAHHDNVIGDRLATKRRVLDDLFVQQPNRF
jgi:hypothetical protein